MQSLLMRLARAVTPIGFRRRIKSHLARRRGNQFHNQGAISDGDFAEIRRAIDALKPAVFIELGTGRGVSTTQIFDYLSASVPGCRFFTVEIFQELRDAIAAKYASVAQFTAIHGLTVTPEETVDPARTELRGYRGPVDVLRKLLRHDLGEQTVDIAFIDTRKGSALPEFLVLEPHMSSNGIIYCHDVLNGGKGVEVLAYVKGKPGRYRYDVLHTGPEGLLRIERA